jgi:hypothetical protein
VHTPPVPQSEAVPQRHRLQDVPLFVPCTHLGGVISPGGFVPQPLDAVVKESSDGSESQQLHPIVVLVVELAVVAVVLLVAVSVVLVVVVAVVLLVVVSVVLVVVTVVLAVVVSVVVVAVVLLVVVTVVLGVVVVVVLVVLGGQGFGEQGPGPTSIPLWALHSAALSTMQVSKAPVADDCRQHWICGCVVVVVLDSVVVVVAVVVVVLVGRGAVVVVVAGLVVVVLTDGHAAQQLLLAPTVPPSCWHSSAECSMLHWLPCTHVTPPALPQTDIAAQRTTFPRHPGETSFRAAWATQLT